MTWITLQIALKIDASNLYCKITLVWLDSSLGVQNHRDELFAKYQCLCQLPTPAVCPLFSDTYNFNLLPFNLPGFASVFFQVLLEFRLRSQGGIVSWLWNYKSSIAGNLAKVYSSAPANDRHSVIFTKMTQYCYSPQLAMHHQPSAGQQLPPDSYYSCCKTNLT